MKSVELRRVAWSDGLWLCAVGLDPRKIGEQYSWREAYLQPLIAPWRALRAPGCRAALVIVDGKRAGYIGPNPKSKNIEYFVQPRFRGGIGTEMVAEYFRLFGRHGGERFWISHHNERSLGTLLGGFRRLDWDEGQDFVVTIGERGRVVVVCSAAESC